MYASKVSGCLFPHPGQHVDFCVLTFANINENSIWHSGSSLQLWMSREVRHFFMPSVSCSSCPTLCNPMDCSPMDMVPLSMEFSRQEYWSGLSFPSPEGLPDPGIEPRSPALQADSLLSEPQASPLHTCSSVNHWMERDLVPLVPCFCSDESPGCRESSVLWEDSFGKSFSLFFQASDTALGVVHLGTGLGRGSGQVPAEHRRKWARLVGTAGTNRSIVISRTVAMTTQQAAGTVWSGQLPVSQVTNFHES